MLIVTALGTYILCVASPFYHYGELDDEELSDVNSMY